MRRDLPDYEHPPAVETAMGVRFAPIDGWNVFHYGLLLERFRADYPKQELRPPLGNVTFQFSPESDFSNVPVRSWFINSDDTQLVQVQNNCFIRNWRKTERTPDYLHYDVIRPLFKRDWQTFISFLRENQLPAPNVWQCEVTYINQFVRGREWHDFGAISNLYPAWKGVEAKGIFERAETLAFSISYALANISGSLQFVSQPGVRKADGTEIIQLTVTALGKPKTSDEDAIFEWLDEGRAAVVSGFTGFTSNEAHAIWGIK